ncbi:MAG: hypothetical protein J6P83_08005 [Bacteroidales bacterium]|nr:hypothetical protein [Bacteroidales bacterium]
MKKNLALSRLIVGLLLTFSVCIVAVVLRNVVKLDSEFFPIVLAILVHMAGNLLGILPVVLSNVLKNFM